MTHPQQQLIEQFIEAAERYRIHSELIFDSSSISITSDMIKARDALRAALSAGAVPQQEPQLQKQAPSAPPLFLPAVDSVPRGLTEPEQILNDGPEGSDRRLLLNAYGRRCYNAGRESLPLADVEDIAARLIEALRCVMDNEPYADLDSIVVQRIIEDAIRSGSTLTEAEELRVERQAREDYWRVLALLNRAEAELARFRGDAVPALPAPQEQDGK
jgi:hypothetical protein